MKRAGDITYDESGSHTGTVPIICLHGIGGDTESFRPQLDGLGADRRVIAWNMPGYGGSEPLPDMTFEALSLALAGFMDALRIDRAHLAGQSIGGMIAQDFALRFPGRVASLVLIGTTPAFGGRDDTFKEAFLKARLGPLESGATMSYLATFSAPDLVGPIAGQDVIDSVARSMAAVPIEVYRAVLECLVTFNRRDDQGNISQPACLIAGTHDNNAPAKTMQKMASRLPDARYHLIDGAGHMINLEAPDQCNRIIGDFVASIDNKSELP